MIRSELLTLPREGGELQRVQIVRLDDWASLRFLRGGAEPGALAGTAHIYRRFLVPAAPWLFGKLMLFRLPEGGDDELRAAAEIFRRGLRLRRGKAFFLDAETRALWDRLRSENCVEIVPGKLPSARVLPVNGESFLLSECAEDARLKVNASFFIFDPFDCATRYDTIGTPFGLAVQNGEVLLPPLFGREALVVRRDGSVRVETPTLEDFAIRIGDRRVRPGREWPCFTRPAWKKTPRAAGFDHVIIGRRIVEVAEGGGLEVPASGFVLRLPRQLGAPGEEIRYEGMEDVLFAVQAGNSLVHEGRETEGFVSGFWNIRRPWNTPYPPSLYPLDYEKARAARIGLGADAEGKPMLLWAEGAAKIGHVPGEDGCGASLMEFAAICREAGMVEGVNLDGGGSAQILLDGKRALRLSDRDDEGRELERAVPLGLAVE